MTQDAAERANQDMVDQMIAEGSLWSRPVIAAFRATPRHKFLDRVFQFNRRDSQWQEVITRDPNAEELRLVYSDRALITHISPPTPEGRQFPISSSSQPSLMAQMLEDLRLRPGLKVLEIGAGTGYNAALMAHVVGPDKVIAIEVDRNVLSEAWDHLRAYAERRVALHHADGRNGFAAEAPFDRLMVTAATADLEPAWLAQMAEGGELLAPLALAPGLAFLVRGNVVQGLFQGRLTRPAYFISLRDEHEVGAIDQQEFFVPQGQESVPAPWADWFDRRRNRISWLGFAQALAFYGWLRGLKLHYRNAASGEAVFGLQEPEGEALCWFGPQDWQVNGPAATDLGSTHWQAFLEAGGPWPTEFELFAAPDGIFRQRGPDSYLRLGPSTSQLWQLREERERPAWI